MMNEELEKRLAEINAKEPEELSPEELAAVEKAEAEPGGVEMNEFFDLLDGYTGKISIRIPRSLHRRLKEHAAAEGVSLNQYILYSLAQA